VSGNGVFSFWTNFFKFPWRGSCSTEDLPL